MRETITSKLKTVPFYRIILTVIFVHENIYTKGIFYKSNVYTLALGNQGGSKGCAD